MRNKLISPQTWEMRQDLLRQYGGVCTCSCGCQESNLRRLQLHHYRVGGTGERASNRGLNWYRSLLGKPNRDDLHVRCVGCHWEMTIFGACANQVNTEEYNDKIIYVGTSETGGVNAELTPRHDGEVPSPVTEVSTTDEPPLYIEPEPWAEQPIPLWRRVFGHR